MLSVTARRGAIYRYPKDQQSVTQLRPNESTLEKEAALERSGLPVDYVLGRERESEKAQGPGQVQGHPREARGYTRKMARWYGASQLTRARAKAFAHA